MIDRCAQVAGPQLASLPARALAPDGLAAVLRLLHAKMAIPEPDPALVCRAEPRGTPQRLYRY